GDALYACPLMPSTVTIRRRALGRVEHWFDRQLELGEDKDLFLRLLLLGARAVVQPEALVLYRVHPMSSQGDGERYSASNLKCLDKLFGLDLPAEFRRKRESLYGHYYLQGCLH